MRRAQDVADREIWAADEQRRQKEDVERARRAADECDSRNHITTYRAEGRRARYELDRARFEVRLRWGYRMMTGRAGAVRAGTSCGRRSRRVGHSSFTRHASRLERLERMRRREEVEAQDENLARMLRAESLENRGDEERSESAAS